MIEDTRILKQISLNELVPYLTEMSSVLDSVTSIAKNRRSTQYQI